MKSKLVLKAVGHTHMIGWGRKPFKSLDVSQGQAVWQTGEALGRGQVFQLTRALDGCWLSSAFRLEELSCHPLRVLWQTFPVRGWRGIMDF